MGCLAWLVDLLLHIYMIFMRRRPYIDVTDRAEYRARYTFRLSYSPELREGDHVTPAYGSSTWLLVGNSRDARPVRAVVTGTRGRVRLRPVSMGFVRHSDTQVSGNLRRGNIAVLNVTATGVGEPEGPGDVVTIVSRHGTIEIEVWIEPSLGQWRDRPDGRPMELGIVGVHAALVRSAQVGRVLLFSPPRRRTREGSFEMRNGEYQWALDALRDVEIRSVDTTTFDAVDVPMQGSGLDPINLFCTGHAHLGDGRVMVAGGHISAASIWEGGQADNTILS